MRPWPDKQYDRVVDGVADIVYGLPGYTASQFPLTLVTEIPGVLKPDTGTQALWKNISSLDGEFKRVKLLGIWNNPESVLMTKAKPIRTFEDLKGLKIRVSSRNVGDVLTAWGATPVSMPITEVYNAMSTGVIDGVYTDASVLKSFKLEEVTQYVSKGMDSALSPLFIIMNRDAWNGLGDAEKAALDKITGVEISEKGRKIQADHADSALKAFTGGAKEVITLADTETAKFNEASAKLLKATVAELDGKGLKASDLVSALKQ
ncbi:TRAP transporter substrate-binding protein [Thiothrix subterranea]|uniref:TRAP transporter substrate-binding protein n=1 Tax=Thiothrix subterranea TaxID=2735563 RepID=UPI00280A631F|nr:TRAP transporter substrate-binding protein [Thiothrix subterranea]